jgi:hypothetical protein
VKPKAAKRFAVRLRIPNRTTSKLYAPTPAVSGLVSLSVNGKPVTPVMEKGYAVVTRDWKAGDKIELELPLKVQLLKPADEIAALHGKVALRYGPMIYNIERVDQDIAKPLAADPKLSAEWRGDLLGGVTVIKGQFADGSPMLAVPNYARVNREKDLGAEAGPQAADPSQYLGPAPAGAPQGRPQQGPRPARPVASEIWIKQA